jgi:hypothetical protein
MWLEWNTGYMVKPRDEGESVMSKISKVLLRSAGSLAGLLVGGISAGLILYLPAALLALFVSGDSDDDGLGTWVLIVGLGVLAGASVGAALGANIAQKAVRQRSSFQRALLGAVAGATIGVMCGLAGFDIGMMRLAIFLPVPIVAGAVLGSGWKAKPAKVTDPSG